MFDADMDGNLKKDEYRQYLLGCGAWGASVYTKARWDSEGWPGECDNLGCSVEVGITRVAFETILYIKYRMGKAQTDLDSCKAAAGAQGFVCSASVVWR